MIHTGSLLIPIAVLLPNLLFFGKPPRNVPKDTNASENGVLMAAEGIGRMGTLVLPVFSTIHIDKTFEVLSLMGMFIFLLFYYLGWIRYFREKREYHLLFKPMFGLPVPLAVSPILYFLSASVVLQSNLLFLSSLILAIGHIPLSLISYRSLK